MVIRVKGCGASGDGGIIEPRGRMSLCTESIIKFYTYLTVDHGFVSLCPNTNSGGAGGGGAGGMPL